MPFDREKLRRVAVAYLRAATLRVAAWSMDQFARLSLLEGAAGVAPGHWLQKKERGFGPALDHFGPKLASGWIAATDQGVYDKAIAAATRMLKLSPITDIDALDLVQDLVTGSASSSGPERNRMFYAVGTVLRKHEADLGQGTLTPNHSLVKGTIENWVSNAIRDLLRAQKRRPPELHGKPGLTHLETMHSLRAPELDDDERSNLLLLRLQNPGGKGAKVRGLIDHLIDQSFPPKDRPVVRSFLEKIGQPRYRSPAEMKQIVTRFDPAKWVAQASNLVRKELMEELGVSAQRLTNILGRNAANVFKFMREKVGRDPQIVKIVNELADEIELGEPGLSRLATHEGADQDEVVEKWLVRQRERGANLDSGSAIGGLEQDFEKDDMYQWDVATAPYANYARGPVVLRVAMVWLTTREGLAC
jgi:hypothetical protein